MKRFLMLTAALALVWPAAGCSHHNLCGGGGCGGGGCGLGGCGDSNVVESAELGMPQAPGHVVYPYYTLKGPRDFLYTPETR
jgi:hypothetical protein